MKSVIFVGIPCYGSVAPEVLEDMSRFWYHCGRRLPQFEFLLAIRTKSEQFRARNTLVDAFLQTNADYLLMLDDDMIMNPVVTQGPTSDYLFLEKLVAHDKDICGVLYYQRMGACNPVLMTRLVKGYRFLRDEEITGGLQEVDVAGGGCLLIKRRVFDKLPRPFFAPEFEYGTDIQLCRAAQEHDFEVFADTSIEFGHVREERTIVTSRNRAQFQIQDGMPGEVTQRFVSADVYGSLVADAHRSLRSSMLNPERDADGTVDGLLRAFDVQGFLGKRKTFVGTDAEWYWTYAAERVARQVWFNHTPNKRAMTEFLIASVGLRKHADVLDFGCGIGIPAFTLAQRGHHVTACDIGGTGTLEFLKWRAEQHGVSIQFWEGRGGAIRCGPHQFDVIVAMDCLEHIDEWPAVLEELAAHLKPNGVLFANNAILEDDQHPEHYHIDHKEFISRCLAADLMPVNQITYVKQASVRELAHAG
jgi:2-polyprenyl-3-methyl-5-hydroxy-6-metoxy-1,4-benzoquinol methylase